MPSDERVESALRAAHRHQGFAFVRVLQRCPMYTGDLYAKAVRDPSLVELLVHDDGLVVPELEKIYKQRVSHDPRDLDAARRIAEPHDRIPIGVLFRDESRPRYETLRPRPTLTAHDRVALLNAELDKYAV